MKTLKETLCWRIVMQMDKKSKKMVVGSEQKVGGIKKKIEIKI